MKSIKKKNIIKKGSKMKILVNGIEKLGKSTCDVLETMKKSL